MMSHCRIRTAFLLLIPFISIGSTVGGEPSDPCALPCAAPLDLEQLVHMGPCELEQRYRQAEPGSVPVGYMHGRAIRWAGHQWAVPASRLTGLLWHGKWFDDCDNTLLNEWCFGVKAIQAQVYYGPSWLDGQPAIIMDYGETSTVWRDVRDELRQVGPCLYLGVMFQRKCAGPKFKMFFALATPPCRE